MLAVGVALSDGAITTCELDIVVVAVGAPSNDGDAVLESDVTTVALAAGGAVLGESDCDIDIAGADDDGGGWDPESVGTAAELCEQDADAENDDNRVNDRLGVALGVPVGVGATVRTTEPVVEDNCVREAPRVAEGVGASVAEADFELVSLLVGDAERVDDEAPLATWLGVRVAVAATAVLAVCVDVREPVDEVI